MCIRALRMESSDGSTKATVCKTISCLLPTDLEVKRACQLTEFLMEPTVDSYYAVETLYNEPDEKLEENMPVPNSLRCELLLVFKTKWPFDPEFWNWKALKRHCLALMGEEASIVSSIDLLNNNEDHEEEEESEDIPDHLLNSTYELGDMTDKKQKNREMKKLREKGFISARFRNWQAYMQYCVLCDKEFLGHRIVRHAQTHLNGGEYSCPICAQTFTSKDTLIPHVTSHVKQSCKERLSAMKTNKTLANSKTVVPAFSAFKSKTDNNLSKNGGSLGHRVAVVQVARCKIESCEDNVCPVGKCRRNFKYFKNLIAHVKSHRDNEEAKTFLELQRKKVVCQYCRRHFVNVTHLNDHLQVHCGVKPYICIQLNCKGSFLSNTELLVHRRTHPAFKAKCMFPNCGKIFSEAFKLYDHEAQHYKTFTCKVLDCGKVFHSQQQLDLHQEKHVNQEEGPSSEQTKLNLQPGPSLVDQMISCHVPLKQENYQETFNTEFAVNPEHGRMPDSIANLLQSSQSPVEISEHYRVKNETENVQNISVIQPVNSHLPNPNGDGSVGHSFDYIRSPQQRQLVPPFEANFGNLPHSCNADTLQGQTQGFPRNIATGSMSYNADCSLILPGQLGPVCSGNLLVEPCPNSTEPAMSQPLPPSITPQPMTGNRAENASSSTTSTGPPDGQRERFHCALETCARTYSSYRSVIKHMKTIHPDFYEQWKTSQTTIRITYAPALSISSIGNPSSLVSPPNQLGLGNGLPVHGVQRQNVIQSPTYSNMGSGTNYSNLPSHSSSAHNQDASLLMENVLNPIVVAQLERDTNLITPHSHVAGGLNWHSIPANDQIPNCSSSQGYPSNMQRLLQVDSTSTALPTSVPSFSMMGSRMNRHAQSLPSPLMENKSQSFFPLYMNGENEGLQQEESVSSYTSQMQCGSLPEPRPPGKHNSMQNQLLSSFPSQDACETNINQNGPVVTDSNCDDLKPAKRKRTKWPAIIKNGKFVCCRCFRQFNCPKSLGGHLSKRSICKPYEESELNTDLPASFLDLLNSEQTVGAAQPPLSYGPAAVYQDEHHQSVTSGSTAAKNVPTPNFPRDDLPAYVKCESNEDILTQVMAESDMSDLFLHTPGPQTLFQNAAVPHGSAELFPGNSVIQHTENVHLKPENTSYRISHYPQQSVDTSAANHVVKKEILSEGYHSESAGRTPDTETNPAKQIHPSNSQHSPATSGSKQSDMQWKTTEPDIKRKLREQILAGDFQRRNSLSKSGIVDPNAISKTPMSFLPVCSAGKYGLDQMSNDAKRDSATEGQEHSIIPGSSDDIEQLLSTQSFTCFRVTSTPHQEVLSPTGTVAVETDPDPAHVSDSQQQWMTEIQSAFERLDLIQETAEGSSTVNQNSINVNSQTRSAKEQFRIKEKPIFIKPFVCESESCTFSSVSSDSLWRHLSKTHNYTLDMVNVVKKKYGQYAPYKCQKCSKTYTRNSNLRTHYQSVHKFSAKEIADLDTKRRLAKAAAAVALQSPPAGMKHDPDAQTTITTHSSAESRTHSCFLQDEVKIEYESQACLPLHNMDVTNHTVQDDCSTLVTPLLTSPLPNQALAQPSQPQTSMSAESRTAVEEWLHGRQRHQPKVSTQYPSDQQFGAHSTKPSAPLTKASSGLPLANRPQYSDERYRNSRQVAVKPDIDITKKTKEKKPKSGDALSPYRPYCCVHQGCVAAFTIQHNLILHYRAVHQSALSALEVNKEQEQRDGLEEMMDHDEGGPEIELSAISEFRCQVKDCSRVFQEVPNLLQHYLQLHEFDLDKVDDLLSGIMLGKFVCGHQGCPATFTAFWKYIGHVKEHHKDLKLENSEQLNGSFKCEVEGCDRWYTTKSNMLRHAMKKHQELYQPGMMNPLIKDDGMKQNSKTVHHQITKTSNGKENIESNKKVLQRKSDTKRVGRAKSNHWTKYGKPSLKSKVEASAMCTKTFPLQYPCMIKGCESVMNSERSILKHYIGHGLSEKYLEQQRSCFIFCKKFPKQKGRSIRSDDSKSDNASDPSDNELQADAHVDGGEFGYSKPVLRKRIAAGIPTALFESKVSNDESSDGSVVLKRKRGRPRKLIEKIIKRKKIPRTTKTAIVYSKDDESESECSPAALQEEMSGQGAPLATFKPMGFEMSFLKFLEQSKKSELPLTRKIKVLEVWKKPSSLNTKDTCVRFRNSQNLKSLSKVKIIVDKTFSGVTDLMLKQLQDMLPTVVLGEKKDY